MRVYLAGPMRGLADFNYPSFDRLAALVRSAGLVAINPADLDRSAGFDPAGDIDAQRSIALRRDLVALSEADAICLLPGWQKSPGARVELAAAREMGLAVLHAHDFGFCPPPSLIGLCGYAGSGKDTVGSILILGHGYARRAFADPLKAVASRIGWDGRKNSTGRRLLQDLGLAMREEVDESVWIAPTLEDLPERCVVTDVRFPNEAAAIRAQGGEVWRVTRPNTGPANSHESETALDELVADAEVSNHGDIDHLATQVERLLELHERTAA